MNPHFCLGAARSLTLARIVGILPFLVLLILADREEGGPWGAALFLLYLFVVLSDLLDGVLARTAGAPSRLWGQVDAFADILFNSASLCAAAWLGLVGFWVPLGVMVLGGRFLLRSMKPRPAQATQLPEDRLGKAAGVLYYLLVGAIALEIALDVPGARVFVARAGDGVSLYTLFVLAHNRPQATGNRQQAPPPHRPAT